MKKLVKSFLFIYSVLIICLFCNTDKTIEIELLQRIPDSALYYLEIKSPENLVNNLKIDDVLSIYQYDTGTELPTGNNLRQSFQQMEQYLGVALDEPIEFATLPGNKIIYSVSIRDDSKLLASIDNNRPQSPFILKSVRDIGNIPIFNYSISTQPGRSWLAAYAGNLFIFEGFNNEDLEKFLTQNQEKLPLITLKDQSIFTQLHNIDANQIDIFLYNSGRKASNLENQLASSRGKSHPLAFSIKAKQKEFTIQIKLSNPYFREVAQILASQRIPFSSIDCIGENGIGYARLTLNTEQLTKQFSSTGIWGNEFNELSDNLSTFIGELKLNEDLIPNLSGPMEICLHRIANSQNNNLPDLSIIVGIKNEEKFITALHSFYSLMEQINNTEISPSNEMYEALMKLKQTAKTVEYFQNEYGNWYSFPFYGGHGRIYVSIQQGYAVMLTNKERVLSATPVILQRSEKSFQNNKTNFVALNIQQLGEQLPELPRFTVQSFAFQPALKQLASELSTSPLHNISISVNNYNQITILEINFSGEDDLFYKVAKQIRELSEDNNIVQWLSTFLTGQN
jgi:hypothetical protein